MSDQRGSADVVTGIVVTIVILALARVLGFDLMGYLAAAVDWTADAIRHLGDAVNPGADTTPHVRHPKSG